MITVRKAEDRGHADHGWLKTFHTFSFARYHDPKHMGFATLRVINDDYVAPGKGFGTHPHDNMEIVTYVLSGALEHKDSMGNGSVIRRGEVQRMSAGTGITHSEFNHSDKEDVHLLQIWFLPDTRGVEPGYEQKLFADDEKRGKFRLVASKEGRDGSVSLHQDVDMSAALLSKGDTSRYALRDGRKAWVHVATGSVSVNGVILGGGDGAAVEAEKELVFDNANDAEVLLFDMKPIAA